LAYFVVSYDLIRNKDYQRIIDELERLGAAKMLLSQWLLDASNTAQEVKDHLTPFVDDDDRLVVIEFSKRPAFTRMFTTGADWIKARF